MSARRMIRPLVRVLGIVALSLIILCPSVARAGGALPRFPLTAQVTLVSRVLGGNAQPGMLSTHRTIGNVAAADLGAPARYQNRWYLAFGDATYSLPVEPVPQNFLVGTASFKPGSPMRLTGYISVHQFASGIAAPIRAIRPDPGYAIPATLFTVRYLGNTKLFAEYVVGGDVGGFGHWSNDTLLARFDDATRVFRPYMPASNIWKRDDGRPLQYSFGQSSFWQDSKYLYMAGTTTNRFGGLKLARMPLRQFMSATNTAHWQYYLGWDRWSAPTADEMAIDAQVPWLIPPTDPAFSYDQNYLASGCNGLGIGEFSIVWDAYLARFLLLTGTDSCTQQGLLRIYTAPALTGPWTSEPALVAMPNQDWDYYAPYSGPDLVANGGRTVYFLASTYRRYGVYLYRMDF
jgi:hypothetical protein